MRMRLRGTVLLLAAVSAAACAHGRPGVTPRPVPVPVRVTNNNRADVVISVVRAGSAMRLGTVVSGQTQVLTIRNVPVERLQALQFDIHQIGTEETFRTRTLSLGPEQMVVLRIEDLLSTSALSVAENPSPGKRMP